MVLWILEEYAEPLGRTGDRGGEETVGESTIGFRVRNGDDVVV